MIIVELIEEFLLPVVLMIYVAGLALVLSKIRQRITGTRIDQCSTPGQPLATHGCCQEAEILSNQ